MKTWTLAFLCLAIMPIQAQRATPAPTTPSTEFLMEAGKAGQVEIGMHVDDVYRMFGDAGVRLVARFPEGMFQPALEITVPGGQVKPTMVADIDRWPCGEWALQGLRVVDPRFRTTEGFGVGTTERELRRKFSFSISEEEGCHCAFIKRLQMTFSFDGHGPVGNQRVTGVSILSDPVAVHAKRCPNLPWARGR